MMYDFANSAFATTILAVIFNQYFAGVIAGGAAGTDFDFFGFRFNLPGAALFELSVLFGTLVTVVVSPFAGIYADLTGSKKKLLVGTLTAGSLFTAALALIQPGEAVFGGFIFGIALACFFLSLNFYNAFLPQICAPADLGLVSGISWAIGYLGGGGCLLLNLIMLENPQVLGFARGTFGIRHVILSVAIWWLVFSLPLILWVRERPASSATAEKRDRPHRILRNLQATFRELRLFNQLWIFLLAYIFFTNGIETTISSASIFGNEELGMDTGALIVLFLIVQFTAFPGAILFGVLVDRFGNKISLMISLSIWLVALAWVYNLGIFLEPVREFQAAAVLVGLVMGGSQAAARSLFASFTPVQRSAEFFSFYGIAGRISATLGPLAFAAVNTATRSVRQSILVLVFFFLCGMIVLSRVHEAEGIRQSRRESA
jgi:UMF1 family MFS transporter